MSMRFYVASAVIDLLVLCAALWMCSKTSSTAPAKQEKAHGGLTRQTRARREAVCRLRFLLLFVFILLGVGCSGTRAESRKQEEDIWQFCQSHAKSSSHYFPNGVFDKNPESDQTSNCLESQLLIAAKEQPLSPPPSGVEVYRLLWLQNRDAIVVRIEQRSSYFVVAKILKGRGWLPAELVVTQAHDLTPSQRSQFKALVLDAKFWELPSPAPPEESLSREVSVVIHGARLILEGVGPQGYHAVDIYSPSPSGPYASYRKLCLYMRSLSSTEPGTETPIGDGGIGY